MGSEELAGALTFAVGRSRVTVAYRSIVEIPAEVLVSSDDTHVSMGGGVSKAIRTAGGAEIQQEARTQLPASLGDVIVTRAGTLAAKYILHAIVLDFSQEMLPTGAPVIRTAVRKCLDLCVRHGARTIAFPALATGAAQVQAEEAAAAIIVEIVATLSKDSAIDHVYLALNPAHYDAGDVARRFYLQVTQYVELTEAARRIERMVDDSSWLPPPAGPAAAAPTHTQVSAVRTGLDAGMREATTQAFNDEVAPHLAEELRDATKKLESRIGEPGSERASTRQEAERLRLQIEIARIEWNRLNWEDTMRGGTTDERQQRQQFLLGQQRKFEEQLKSLGSGRRPLVVSLHGIRTRGAWQKEINIALNQAGFDHQPVDYGRFGLIRFLLPFARNGCVDRFRDNCRQKAGESAEGNPSLIAHSLGSYIATKAMARYGLRFDQVILCGSIVPTDYDWDAIVAGGFADRVLNDHGRVDTWARVAEYVVADAGASGLSGFERTAKGKVINRDHPDWGHSTYFHDLNYARSWIPFLQKRDPERLPAVRPPKVNRRFRRTMFVLASMLVLALAAWWWWW